MGYADALVRKYMRDPAKFADVFNYAVYGGRQVIVSSELRLLDPTSVAISNKQKRMTVQRHRDGLRLWQAMRDGRAAYVLLGIEHQTDVNGTMAVRGMLYDAMAYQDQVDELGRKNRAEGGLDARGVLSGLKESDRLMPVVTIVLHMGPGPWDGPTGVHDMLGECDAELLPFVCDYRINLVSPASMSDADLGKFSTELGLVLGYIKYQKDKVGLMGLVTRDGRFRSVGAESVELINALTDSGIEIPKGEGRIDMCQAIRDIRQDGMRQGIVQVLASLVRDGVLTLDDAARRAGLTPEEFKAAVAAL